MSEQDNFPLSLSQQDIYFDQIRNIKSSVYNVGGYVRCSEIDLEKIKLAHKKIVAGNDAFGLKFSERNGSVFQYVTSSRDDNLPIIELSSEDLLVDEATNWVSVFFKQPLFAYDKTLYASVLLKVSVEEYWYVCKCHHLIMDGVGFANWAFKLSDYYNCASPRYETISWSKIVEKDTRYVESISYQNNQKYWHEQFKESIPTKIFPKLRNVKILTSERFNNPLSRKLLHRLNDVAQQLDVNVPNLFLGTLAIYLSYTYEQEKITFGLPAHNRKSYIEKGLLNVFTNISPLCVEIDRDDTFTSLVRTINKRQKENYRHQRFPKGHLSRLLNTQHESYPFSGINFNFLNLDYDSLAFSDKPATVVYHPQQQEELPLTVTFFDGGKSALELQYDFHPAFFSLQDIKMIANRVDHLLTQLLATESLTCPIRELSILPDAEKNTLLKTFVGESRDIGHSFTVQELFLQQVYTDPGHVAITYEDTTLTYRQVGSKTSQLAGYLQKHGCGKGSLVGVYMERSIEMVLAIIGILRAGAAYVPLEPSLPVKRLNYIIKNTGLAHILTTSAHRERLSIDGNTALTSIDSADWSKFDYYSCAAKGTHSLSDIAYVIYTSGSTGEPKGVAVSHRALQNRIEWMDRQYGMSKHDKVLQKTPFSFDVSVWEFLWPLSVGGQLVIAKPEGHKDPRYLIELIESQGITKLHFVPSMLGIMLKHSKVERCSSLRQVFCSGEALTPKQVNDFFSALPGTELHNLYGPTEAAIDVSYWHCSPNSENLVPIGQAIQNTHLLVLNKNLELMPVGVIGELYISGIGLAEGYLNKPDLTESAFITNPYYKKGDLTSSRKLYKTGDLVRYLADGNLEYIGRNDSQVKIRGQRIELSEIESALLEHSGVEEAKILLLGENKDVLAAYIIMSDNCAEATKDVETFIRELLPVYMVPNRFIPLSSWPLTSNGKIDTKQLKTMQAVGGGESIHGPENATQTNLRSLWADLLNIDVEQVCVNQNFFRMGGNSLQCTAMIHEAENRFNYRLALSDIFQNPTISALAFCIDSNKVEGAGPSGLTKLTTSSTSPLSFVQYRIWLAEKISGPTTKHNISGGVKLTGQISIDRIRSALESLVSENTMLITRIGLKEDGEPFQFIQRPDTLPISFHDFSSTSISNIPQKCKTVITDFCRSIFSLHDAELFKVCLLKLPDETVLLYFNFHHIICDGWSVNIAFNKFLEFYDEIESETPVGSELSSYFDYVDWQNKFISTVEADRQRRFWKEHLSGCNQFTELPFKKLNDTGIANSLITEKLPMSSLQALKQMAHQCDASLSNVIHCALAIVLSRITAERDLVLGIPVSGRNIRGALELFGPLVNNLPIRTVVDESQLFVDFLRTQTENLRQVLSHQDLPFENILDLLPSVDRSSKETPLFQVCLNFLSLPVLGVGNASFDVEPEPAVANDNKFKLTFYVSEQPDGLQIQCSYDRQYQRDDVCNLLMQLRSALEQVEKSNGEMLCSGLSLSRSVVAYPLTENGHEKADENHHSVVLSFESAVSRLPDALALKYLHRSWSYQELNCISSWYSEKLALKGVGKGDLVAILSGRSDQLVIAMLAVLKVGAAFLILPEDEPKHIAVEKLATFKFAHLLNLTGIKLEFELKGNTNDLKNIHFNNLDEEKAAKLFSSNFLQGVSCNGDDLAYVAFTSGTEGKPKAIKGRHSALAAYTPWLIKRFGISHTDRFAMLSGLAHDPLQREIFTAFMAGASVHVPSKQEYDLVNIPSWIDASQVTVLNITPSLTSMILLKEQPLRTLSHVFLCGEPLSLNTASRVLEHQENISLVSLYGTTESCRALGYYEVCREELEKYELNGYVSLGKGLHGVELLVLNEQNRICGIGEVGQIAIKAEHLTLGYYNDDKLTSEKFISRDLEPSESKNVYLTGDYGRYDSQGMVNFFSRRDRQIKIRGYRVEPVDIETLIKGAKLVEDVAVNAIKNRYGDNELVAYIVANKNIIKNEKELATVCRQILPEYMLPSRFVMVESIPFNLNGKISWSKLAELELVHDDVVLVEPDGPVEEKIKTIWQATLEKPSVCVLDSFFDIGGNSISAVRLLTSLNKEFSIEIPFSTFYEKNTIRELAVLINHQILELAVLERSSKNKKVLSI